MAIYKADKKVTNVYRNGKNINKSYKGNRLVYQQNTIPIPPPGYIEIEVDATDGTYTVPLAAIAAEGETYSLNILVNGVFHGIASGIVDPEAGTGYEITALTGQTATIRIEPTGEPVAGWGKAFGHFIDEEGCNTEVNKTKLLRIINDPDFAYLESETSTGEGFRGVQYIGCTRLTAPAVEHLPDSVTLIGDAFRYGQYAACESLTEAAEEYLPPNITEIGEVFRAAQYEGCVNLRQAAKEYLSKNITGIGYYFRLFQYAYCTNLTHAAEEYISSHVNSIGNFFRSGQYANCSGLTKPAKEVLPDSLTAIGMSFRSAEYINCENLRQPAEEFISDHVNSIENNFRDSQYSGCSSITESAEEYLPDNIGVIGSFFRNQQYEDCINLLVGNHIHDHRFPELLNESNSYYRMFELNTQKEDPDTIPRYYTDATHTQTAPVTDITPTSRKYYLTNRTGIEGYDDIAENWK